MVKTENTPMQATPTGSTAYKLEELLLSSAAFGVKPEVITGALQFKYKGKKDKFTKADVKAAIEEFMKKEVK